MRVLFPILCATSLLFIGRLQAQFEYGEILGTIHDASGAVLSGAKVNVRRVDTNVQASTLTNDQGNYSFPGLRSGNYEVGASD